MSQNLYCDIMAKPIPHDAYGAVLAAVAQVAAGADIQHIESQLPDAPTRRTVQRWLNDLVEQGRLRKEGRARATRYLLSMRAPEGAAALAGVTSTGHLEVSLPLSQEARSIENAVRQPVQDRVVDRRAHDLAEGSAAERGRVVDVAGLGSALADHAVRERVEVDGQARR